MILPREGAGNPLLRRVAALAARWGADCPLPYGPGAGIHAELGALAQQVPVDPAAWKVRGSAPRVTPSFPCSGRDWTFTRGSDVFELSVQRHSSPEKAREAAVARAALSSMEPPPYAPTPRLGDFALVPTAGAFWVIWSRCDVLVVIDARELDGADVLPWAEAIDRYLAVGDRDDRADFTPRIEAARWSPDSPRKGELVRVEFPLKAPDSDGQRWSIELEVDPDVADEVSVDGAVGVFRVKEAAELVVTLSMLEPKRLDFAVARSRTATKERALRQR